MRSRPCVRSNFADHKARLHRRPAANTMAGGLAEASAPAEIADALASATSRSCSAERACAAHGGLPLGAATPGLGRAAPHPAGTTTTYGKLAKKLGFEIRRAAIDMGAATIGANPIAIIVPCHRAGCPGTEKAMAVQEPEPATASCQVLILSGLLQPEPFTSRIQAGAQFAFGAGRDGRHMPRLAYIIACHCLPAAAREGGRRDLAPAGGSIPESVSFPAPEQLADTILKCSAPVASPAPSWRTIRGIAQATVEGVVPSLIEARGLSDAALIEAPDFSWAGRGPLDGSRCF
ncbi:hypothetical protein FQR65_LT20407 [Abscondita terminalis]|nr:hypothetical protein FQR65_LT20407 [Abscondita terminalis]